MKVAYLVLVLDLLNESDELNNLHIENSVKHQRNFSATTAVHNTNHIILKM